ncbi:hypothetical protein [Mucilaginibacter glaciei]|nr:hypothetical protein [Mucilaginibacter glaciei]
MSVGRRGFGIAWTFPQIEAGQAFRSYCTGLSHKAGIRCNP